MSSGDLCQRGFPPGFSSVFLDWDGVLVDSVQIYCDLFSKLCSRYSKRAPDLSREAFRNWYKANWEENFFELGFDKAQYEEICAVYPSLIDYDQAPLFSGVKELLEELGSDSKLFIMSTAPTECIRERLESEDLARHFQGIVGSDDGSTEKSERIAACLKSEGLSSGVMVGDTDLDVLAGKKNGLATVGVSYGWISAQRVKAAQPDIMIERPEELLSGIRRAQTLSRF